MDINCDECKKKLFSTNETRMGAVGFEAQKKGFIYKIPALFTDKYERLFFCSNSCYKSFYDKNIPKNENISTALKEIKADIPKMAKECAKRLAEIQSMFNKKINK